MSDEPFGRQPLPVTVTLTGADERDTESWRQTLMRRAEYKGDMVVALKSSASDPTRIFVIYPRAVND